MIPLSRKGTSPSPNQLMDHIRQVLRACFKGTRLAPSSLASLVKALTCVALGLRPAHLIDVCHVTTEQSQHLIVQLQKHPLGKGLVVMQFKDRYTFVCHQAALQKHVDTTLSTPDRWHYVDVRGKQGPPKKRSCPEVLVYWLQERLLPQLRRQSQRYCYFDVVPSYMVALTGWFLEYPVLYCTHDDDDQEGETPATLLVDHELDEWQVRPNCLGDRPLCLVQVWIHHLFDDDHHQQQQQQPHMLLSFTYPDAMDLPNPVQGLTEKYTRRLESTFSKDTYLPSSSSTVHVVLQQVTLDRVAL